MTTLNTEFESVIENLESREWVQGIMQEGESVCAHGAVMTCQGLKPGDEQIIRAVMRAQGLDEEWNDAEGRTKDEVLERMRSIEVTDAALEDTFGPQFREIVALIRRAAVLTDDEAERMDAAWDVSMASAWDAAWDVSMVAAWVAAGVAARAAVGVAAMDAVGVAARVLAVRDLVGHHGLEQHHIDPLMAPWIAGVGENWNKEAKQ